MVKGRKRVVFMRHGNILDNGKSYDKMEYDEFMRYLLKNKNPELKRVTNNKFSLIINIFSFKKKSSKSKISLLNKYKIKKIPNNIDHIFHSSSRRSIQTAKLIREQLTNKPEIDPGIKKLLDEVSFSENIITKEEYYDNGRFRGCRTLLLKRWFYGKNKETFQDTYSRVQKLDNIIKISDYENILLITHGIYLRLIYLYYTKKLKLNDNAEVDVCEENFEELKNVPRLKYGETFEFSVENNIISNKCGENVEKKI